MLSNKSHRLHSSCSVEGNKVQKRRFVKVVKVGPREGLQNASETVSSSDIITFIEMLTAAGCSAVGAMAFVSPKWVLALADASMVMEGVRHLNSSSVSLRLVPNLLGCQRAIMAGATEIAVITSVSETFSLKNMNCSREASLA